MKKILKKSFWLLFLLLRSSESHGSFLSHILSASKLPELKQLLKKEEKANFLKILCEKQIKLKQIPEACFSIRKNKAEKLCLEQGYEGLKETTLVKALENKDVSRACRLYLLKQLKIIRYREKDLRLFPEKLIDKLKEKS